MNERISDPILRRNVQVELEKLRRAKPSPDAIRTGYAIADNRYRSAVCEGDPFSSRFWCIREGFAQYGEMVGVDPRSECDAKKVTPDTLALAKLLAMGGTTTKQGDDDDDNDKNIY